MPSLQGSVQVEQLQQLAAQIQHAIEDYARGETSDTTEIVRLSEVLQHRAELPEVFAARLRYAPLNLCALMIAVETGILQTLSEKGTEEITAEQLSASTGRPKRAIVRTLRSLTATGVCEEIGVQRYRANNKTSVMASKGQIGGLRVSSLPVCGIVNKIQAYCSSYVNDAERGNEEPPSAYEFTYGKPMYDLLRENPDRKADFDAYMEGRKQESHRAWHNIYPVKSELLSMTHYNEQADTPILTIVDVGGNRGHDLESFAKSNPGFTGRLILQDLPETIGPLVADGEKRVFEAMPYDFFTPQPVRGAKVYLLLACLHNWGDEAARNILRNLADAMERNYSRLFISAMLLPDIGAGRRAAELDMQMWVLQQSQQRSRNEVEELVHSVGLDIVKIWENGERESIVEVWLPERVTNGLD